MTSLTELGLAPLGNYGGPTQTMALLPGSAAIGAGVIADYPGTTTPIMTDQRGEPLDTPRPDIGAYQTQGSTLIALAFSGISNPSITYGTSSVTISGTLANGSQALVGETVAVTLDGVEPVEQSATIGSGGAFSTTFDTTGLIVANSPYTITYVYTSDGTFASESTTSSLTITPATLTITADPETKVYGTADPALAYTATGFQFNDTAGSVLTGSLARAEAGTLAGEQAGNYAIGQGMLAADSNYTIMFTGNALTITPATLTIAAEPETKVFGSADPTLSYTSSGFQFSDTAATVLTGSLARAAGESVPGGPYAIGQGTLAADSNYTIHFTGSSLSITPATPAVTVSDPGGTDTGAPIAATASVRGVDGAAAPSLEGVAPTLTYYAGAGTSGTDLGPAAPSAAGTYTVVARFPGSADYAAADSEPATFVIAPVAAPAVATVILTSPTSSPVYGEAVTFVATVTSAGGTPVGTVTFTDGTTPLATVALDGSGRAAVTISTLSPGSHVITATYDGVTGSLAVNSGTTAESVSQAATAIVLAPPAALTGKKKPHAVGLTVQIDPVAPGGGVPTGRVTFEFVRKHGKKVRVKTLGTAALSGGEATATFKPSQVPQGPLTVVYSGDPDFLASTMILPGLTRSGISGSRT